jgi:hypothetical protein
MSQSQDQARDCAEYYQIPGQRENESESAFCARVAGRLREMGHIVEAHEIVTGKRFDEAGGGQVMTGLTGALAMAFQDRQYSHEGRRMLGDDFAAGTIAQDGRPKMTPEMALLMVEMLGRRA